MDAVQAQAPAPAPAPTLVSKPGPLKMFVSLPLMQYLLLGVLLWIVTYWLSSFLPTTKLPWMIWSVLSAWWLFSFLGYTSPTEYTLDKPFGVFVI